MTVSCLLFALAAVAGAARSAPVPAGVIAFVREDPDRADINAGVNLWIVRRDGRSARRIVGSSGRDEAPAWSPDGGRIALVPTWPESRG